MTTKLEIRTSDEIGLTLLEVDAKVKHSTYSIAKEIQSIKEANEFNRKKWISEESLINLLSTDNLCYITKERLLKAMEKQ